MSVDVKSTLKVIQRIKKVFIHKDYECNAIFLGDDHIRVSVIYIPTCLEVRYTTGVDQYFEKSQAAKFAIDQKVKESRDDANNKNTRFRQ